MFDRLSNHGLRLCVFGGVIMAATLALQAAPEISPTLETRKAPLAATTVALNSARSHDRATESFLARLNDQPSKVAISSKEPKPESPPTNFFPTCVTCSPGIFWSQPLCKLCNSNRVACESWCGWGQVDTFSCSEDHIQCVCNDGRQDNCECYDCGI